MKNVLGYSLFSVRRVLHGAHIRPFELCKELGVPLTYPDGPSSIPVELLRAIAMGETLLVFPGYTADQLSLLLMYLSKIRGCRLLLDVADIPYFQYKYLQGEPSSKSITDFARLVRISDVLLFSTKSLLDYAAKFVDINGKRIFVIGNASDPHHFGFTPLPKRKVILFVGGYIPARGVDELIEAFKILRRRRSDCTLRLAGLRYPESFGIEGVEILREVYYPEIPAAFSDSYVFVIPHRPNLYMDIAAPLKLFDAMAAGRPIVSTPCHETAAILEREGCGLVTGSEPSSIADGIEYLLENPKIAAEMGRRGRAAIENKYSWKLRADELRRIIQEAR